MTYLSCLVYSIYLSMPRFLSAVLNDLSKLSALTDHYVVSRLPFTMQFIIPLSSLLQNTKQMTQSNPVRPTVLTSLPTHDDWHRYSPPCNRFVEAILRHFECLTTAVGFRFYSAVVVSEMLRTPHHFGFWHPRWGLYQLIVEFHRLGCVILVNKSLLCNTYDFLVLIYSST